jgi:hypothetical protein
MNICEYGVLSTRVLDFLDYVGNVCVRTLMNMSHDHRADL